MNENHVRLQVVEHLLDRRHPCGIQTGNGAGNLLCDLHHSLAEHPLEVIYVEISSFQNFYLVTGEVRVLNRDCITIEELFLELYTMDAVDDGPCRTSLQDGTGSRSTIQKIGLNDAEGEI